jgi:hypothetical protein
VLQDILHGRGYSILFKHCMALQDTGHHVLERKPPAMYFEDNVRTWQWARRQRDRDKRAKRPVCEADHSPPSNTADTYAWNCSSVPSYVLMDYTLQIFMGNTELDA